MERISGGDLFSRGNNTDQLSHVPQQSRRDKLRVQQSNQLHQQQHFNFDPTFLSSEMISFSKNNNNQPNSGDQVINNYLEAMVMSGNELALLPNFPNNNNQSITTTLLPNNNNLQGLSLSLSSSSNPPPPHHDQTNKILLSSSTSSSSSSAYMGSISNPYRNSGPLGPFTGYATILKSSKFLRPAQQLLDGFCCGSNQDHPIINARTTTTTDNVSVGISGSGSGSGGSNNYEIISNIGGEHHQQQQQHKKAKLLYMQEEVSKRYKQYRQQMDMVVSSFESVAGLSSSTPYVSLALEAMSQHFRCLKMAISDQLKHTRRALGEEIILSSSSSPTSNNNSKDNHHQRLKYNNSINMDYHEISFQKHMNNNNNNNNKSSSNSNSGPNKLMMSFQQEQQEQQQQPVWRPQRGLPERSVAVLRAWLFDHFLHPYPTDTDKHMLANQTGLTRNQVSNWFINARVRVWKPMVEEIHTLETKGTLTNNTSTTTNTTTTDHDHHHHHHTISNIIKNHNDHDDDHNDEQNSTKVVGHLINKELEYCSGTSYSTTSPYLNRDQISQGSHHHHQEKRSRLDGHDHDDDDQVQTLVGFVPYHRTELQVWSSHNAPQ
ncbi:hypothetical protein CsatA_008585 [Cannabis sativa]